MFLSATSSGVVEALTSGLTSVAGEMTSAVSGVVPIALTVMGGILVVTIGIKAFKKFSK